MSMLRILLNPGLGVDRKSTTEGRPARDQLMVSRRRAVREPACSAARVSLTPAVMGSLSPRLLLALRVLLALAVVSASPPPRQPISSDTELDQVAAASSLSDVELETGDDGGEGEEEVGVEEGGEGDSSPDSQHLFPSFSAIFPPLGHSRPSFFPETSGRGFQLETFRYTPRSNPNSNLFASSQEEGDGVLGSGNFGVIRGGTFYSGGSNDAELLRGNNAHSRPYRRPNPPPLYRGGGDFFQGFRDFADITTPTKGAYSQYVVVYANRNGASGERYSSPRNILEQLEMLEAEEKKKSKSKKKLESYREKEKQTDYNKKAKYSPKHEILEPLLALS